MIPLKLDRRKRIRRSLRWMFLFLLLERVSVLLPAKAFSQTRSSACSNSLPEHEGHQRKIAYDRARSIRIARGHDSVSQAAYLELLRVYPNDATTASHLAATDLSVQFNPTMRLNGSAYAKFRNFLQKANFTSRHVGQALGVTGHRLAATSPIYLTPAAAGTLTAQQVEGMVQTPVDCLAALFLLGATVPRATIDRMLGDDFGELAHGALSILQPSGVDPTRWMATVQLFPVQRQATRDDEALETLYFITDWHPRVFSQTKVGENEEEAVMYLGPDSLGLVDHFWKCSRTRECGCQILDVCTGCGIQGIFGVQQTAARHETGRVTCLDINPRALRFVVANALLNHVDLSKISLVQADLQVGRGSFWGIKMDSQRHTTLFIEEERPLLDILQKPYDVVAANPPFLPVPPSLISRHGAFSDGGGTGEQVLQAIVQLTSQVLRCNGVVAVVSEFFLAKTEPAAELVNRIQDWGRHSLPSEKDLIGFLVTNEFPISRETYAARRANDLGEYQVWMQHLENIEMDSASPGFLFARIRCFDQNPRPDDGLNGTATIRHVVAPKSPYGSLWTPANPAAVLHTTKLLDQVMSAN